MSQKVFTCCIGAAGAQMFGRVLFVFALPGEVKRRSCKETRESAQLRPRWILGGKQVQ